MSRLLLAALLLVLAGCAQPRPPAPAFSCLAPSEAATEVQLYFGRDKPGGEVSEAEWLEFLEQVVTPAFPDGLTALDAEGRWLDPAAGHSISERSKIVVLYLFDRADVEQRVSAIAESYKARFQQQSVLSIERPACVAFR